MNTVVEQLKSILTPEIIETVSQALDEPKDNVVRALEALFPIMVGGIVQKQEEIPDCGIIDHLTNLLKEQALWDGGSVTADYVGIRNILMGEGEQAHQSARFVALIFGDRIEQLTNDIAGYAGIKVNSSYSLIILAGTNVIAILTKNAFDNNFLPTALLKSLEAQRKQIFSVIPLNLLGLLGLNKQKAAAAKTADIASQIKKNNFIKIIILIFALLIISFLLLKSCSSVHHFEEVTTMSEHRADKNYDKSRDKLGKMEPVSLPNGGRVRIPAHGVERRLIKFIADSRIPASHSPWFAFDRLKFNTNSAVLSPDSSSQLISVAQILNAYPSVRILVGGFTDDTGNKSINTPLSVERARAVKNYLVSQGVNQDRIVVHGFGQSHPVKSNLTEKGRAANRRAGIRVLQK